VSSVLHHEATPGVLERIRRVHTGRIVRLHVEDRESNDPFLSRVARTHGVDFNVVYGGVSELQSRLFGDHTVELLGDDAAIDAAVVDLRRTTSVTEVVAGA
jgi:D-methionine transport system ATP-binding protein